MIPIAQVVAIEFTMPIWTALLAVSFLGERLNAARIVAIVLGLVGVTAIVRPATGHLDPGQLVALAAAVGFAISVIMVKSLTRSESAVAIIFWMLVVQSAIGLVPAAIVWRSPTPAVLPWILVIAICGTYSHYCMTRALQHAEATTIVPMDFLRVPLSALAGWLVYAEAVDLWTVLGAALILGGNALNLRRARRALARRPEPRSEGAAASGRRPGRARRSRRARRARPAESGSRPRSWPACSRRAVPDWKPCSASRRYSSRWPPMRGTCWPPARSSPWQNTHLCCCASAWPCFIRAASGGATAPAPARAAACRCGRRSRAGRRR